MGDYFVDHFAGTREHELEVFRRAVTDWEGGSFFLFLPSLPYSSFCVSWHLRVLDIFVDLFTPESRLSMLTMWG